MEKMTQAAALQLLIERPSMTQQEWMSATGRGERSFYDYRSTAAGAGKSDSEPSPKNKKENQPKRKPLASLTVEAEATPDLAGVGLLSGKGRTIVLFIIFLASQAASVHNMFYSFASASMDWFAIGCTTFVFSMAAMGLMMAGVRNRITIGLVIALVAFEALCNAAATFGSLWNENTQQGTVFLHNLKGLLHYIHPKNIAQIVAIFYAAALALAAYLSVREMSAPQQKTIAVQR